MAIGAYGTNIPIQLSENDISSMVDIYYSYHATRSYDNYNGTTFTALDPSVLKPATRDMDNGEIDTVIEGMYNLQLPLSDFSKKGYYTIYIKPKEIRAVVSDVGCLNAYPNVRGVVIDTTQIENSSIAELARTNNELVGYRMIFLDDNNSRQNYYRIITSNNKCEPIISTATSSSDKTYTYRYNDSSSLIFVTVSPSSTPSFKSNSVPYIGKAAQDVLLVNTFFEPIMIDLEMVEHDADTMSMMLENSQLRNLDNGIVTTYNENNEIYHQAEHFTLKDQYTGNAVYEVKQKRTNNIDFTESISDKLS